VYSALRRAIPLVSASDYYHPCNQGRTWTTGANF